MEDIYEEAVRGFEVPESTSRRVRGLIWDALGLRITYRATEFAVSAAAGGVYGSRGAICWSHSLLEAQSFAWAWLTGPYGVVKDVRFVKTRPNTFGIDLRALVSGIRDYLTNHSA